MSHLPIEAVVPELRRVLASHRGAVLAAPPGSGKTTRIPLALLDEPWLRGLRVVLLEPRRIAARAAATWMASRLGEPVGEVVGYRVRFESRVSARTRVEVLTEGLLTRRLQDDPGLEGVGLVIFDEFHERSLEADLALALTLDARRAFRPDLRVMVMSATLDPVPVAALLDDAPVVTGEGRPFPVTVHHALRAPAPPLETAVAARVRGALDEAAGDVLVFLPGSGEIRRVGERLRDLPGRGVAVRPLHGGLPREEQDRALHPPVPGERRVVLATNVAETSLTIEGIATVVDAGLARRPRHDPDSGLTRLETVRISRASAEQRAGRAGRLGPGTAHRLWTEGAHRGLRAQDPAEILEVDLAGLALELARWGVADPGGLAWLDPPPAGAWSAARALLGMLGALDPRGRLTAAGTRMATLPAHPRLARLLLAGVEAGAADLACDLAALLEESDPLRGDARTAGADLGERLDVLASWRRNPSMRLPGVDGGACARVDRAARALRRRLGPSAGRSGPPTPRDAEGRVAGALLAAAYPDRVARRRPGGEGRYLLAAGRGLRLREDDPLAGSEYLVVPSLDAGATEGRAWLAVAIEAETLGEVLGERFEDVETVAWDPREEAVVATLERRLGAVVLERRGLERPEPERIAAALVEGVARLGLECLPWTPEAQRLQARVGSLRHWRPVEGWPDLGDAALASDLGVWLAPWIRGLTRREHLRRIDLEAALRALVPRHLLARIEQGAPTHLRVPSGSRVGLEYRPGEPPVLAVRLQELFGLDETPRVCWGEVAVSLHLLSPARRPVQVTRDLPGFWRGAYAEVRRELRGRYPKHPWPEDPLSAAPVAGVRRRR